MKKIFFILYCFFLCINTLSLHASEDIEEIKEELEKCDLSFRISLVKDIASCLKRVKNVELNLEEMIKAGFAMLKCTKGDHKKVPQCINDLSEYVLKLEDAKYKELIVCDSIADIRNFQDFVDFEDDDPIFECFKPFGNNPNLPEKTFTKHEFIEQALDKTILSLVDGSVLIYSITELDLYFQYLNFLYEES